MNSNPLWKQILRKIQKETNPIKLAILTNELEEAIFVRQQELAKHDKERTKLVAAMREIYELRVLKLGFPDRANWRRQ